MSSDLTSAGGGSGTIGGTVGTTANAIPVASGTGGSTLAASTVLIFAGNQMSGQLLRQKTATLDIDLAVTDSGRTCEITSGSGATIYNLPAAPSVGTHFHFAIIGADELTVKAQGSQIIYDGATPTAAAGTAVSSTLGSYLFINYVATNKWMTLKSGTWAFT